MEWVEPPTASPWELLLAPLTERPTKWAKVKTMGSPGSASATVSNLRSGVLRRPAGEWEFRSSESHVFARYMGPIEGVRMEMR